MMVRAPILTCMQRPIIAMAISSTHASRIGEESNYDIHRHEMRSPRGSVSMMKIAELRKLLQPAASSSSAITCHHRTIELSHFNYMLHAHIVVADVTASSEAHGDAVNYEEVKLELLYVGAGSSAMAVLYYLKLQLMPRVSLWLGLLLALVLHNLQGVAAVDVMIPKVRAVNLGGWLVIEKWIKPELFDGIPDGDLLDGAQITLQSASKGTFLSAEGGGGEQVVGNRAAISTWEIFKIWRVSAGAYQLRVFNNMFVSAIKGGGGTVLASAPSPSTWETFKIIRNQADPSLVHIQANNGMYLQARDVNQVTADFEGDPGWDNNDATFVMKVSPGMGGEFQLANGWGDSAPAVFEKHRDSFIQEGDFWFLANNGVNAVRIPVGWWIASDPNPPPPYVSGSLQALDNAFQWANNHGIKIIVDLHAAPGSQNGQEHSSSRDGVAEWAVQGGTDYVNESIMTIDFLAARYATNQALLGIELLNEPGASSVPSNVLEYYYKWGYSVIRKHTPSAYVIISARIGGDFAEFASTLPADNVVLDVHLYNLFNAELFARERTAQWNIDFVRNDRLSLLHQLNAAGNALIFVGEWTNEWEVENASQNDYQRFGAAQLEVFGQATFGWAYWSYQNKLNRWSFKQSVQQGYLQSPSDGWP